VRCEGSVLPLVRAGHAPAVLRARPAVAQLAANDFGTGERTAPARSRGLHAARESDTSYGLSEQIERRNYFVRSHFFSILLRSHFEDLIGPNRSLVAKTELGGLADGDATNRGRFATAYFAGKANAT
jgi:hypothetical protein